MTRRNFPSLRKWVPGLILGFAGFATSWAEDGLTLHDAMKAALQNSEEAQLLTQKVAKLEAQKGELLAGILPNVQAFANVGRGAQPTPTAEFSSFFPAGSDTSTFKLPPAIDVALNNYSYGVQVTQPIYSFGRLGLAYRVASKEVRSQDQANKSSRQQIELQTLDAFYAVLTTASRLSVISASERRQSQTVGFLNSNFEMGSGTRSTVLLATSALKALEPQRIRAESDFEAARMRLNRLLGRPVDSPLSLDSNVDVELQAPAVDTSESGLTSILDQRPDLTAMHLQKEALRGYARGYRMQYLPSLGAQAKWGIMAFEPDHQLVDFNNNANWQVGLGLQWTLFDGFSNSSKAHEYDADARSMELNERQARANARIEIETAARDVAAADTAYTAALQARDAAAEADSLISDDFRAGQGQVTDLLSAEEGLRNAEFGLLSARYQKTRARAALRVALGQGLMEEDSQ